MTDTPTPAPPTLTADDTLTFENLRATINSFKPVPKMPRWKDLTWVQRAFVEREIRNTEPEIVRNAMWAEYTRDDDE